MDVGSQSGAAESPPPVVGSSVLEVLAGEACGLAGPLAAAAAAAVGARLGAAGVMAARSVGGVVQQDVTNRASLSSGD